MRIRNSRQLPWHMLPAIFTLAWPTMLEQLMQTAVQYVDTAMVGVLGTQATAAVGATTTVNWLVNSTISAVSIGFLAYISQACGAGQMQQAKKASAQAALTTIVLGIFFTAVTLGVSFYIPTWMQVDPGIRTTAAQYFFILYAPMLFRTATIIFGTVLRAVGDSKTPMKVGIWVNVINVFLNLLLIYPTGPVTVFGKSIMLYGAGWGVLGAAAASAIAFTIGGIMIMVCYLRHRIISPLGMSLRPDMQVLRPCMKVAFPNCLQRFGTSLGYVVFASMINSLGEISTAAHTIANTVESAFYIPGYGMQTAAATLAGNAWGAKDRNRIQDLTRMILPIEVLLMVFSGGLLYIFAPGMMTLFTNDQQVILLGTVVLRMVAVTEPFYGVSIIIEGMMQGMGKTMTPFAFNIAGMWGIRIVGTFICTQLLCMGLVSAWACMIVHNLMLFGAFVYLCVSGRYIPKDKIKGVA